jgi:hypothetical protein
VQNEGSIDIAYPVATYYYPGRGLREEVLDTFLGASSFFSDQASLTKLDIGLKYVMSNNWESTALQYRCKSRTVCGQQCNYVRIGETSCDDCLAAVTSGGVSSDPSRPLLPMVFTYRAMLFDGRSNENDLMESVLQLVHRRHGQCERIPLLEV